MIRMDLLGKELEVCKKIGGRIAPTKISKRQGLQPVSPIFMPGI